MMPPGAPVIPLGLAEIPLVSPPTEGIRAVLHRCLMKQGQDASLIEQAVLREPVRDGLPRARRELVCPPFGVIRKGTRSRDALPYARLEVAYLRDVEGWDRAAIATYLGLTPDEPMPSEGRLIGNTRGSRTAERYVTEGRRLFATLGAWPWAVAEPDRLPKQWWTLPAFKDSLCTWHREAWLEASAAVKQSSLALNGVPSPFALWRAASGAEAEYQELGLDR
jgi:hypothetical protein